MIQPSKRIEHVEEYYFSRKLAEVRALDRPDVPVINLGIGSPDLAPSSATIHALTEAAHHPASHGYQNYKGIPALRQAIARFNQFTYGVSLNPDTDILPLMGSKEGIFHITMAFVNPGDEVLVPDPGYPTYASAAKLAGGTVRTYTLDEDRAWRIDIAALNKQDLSRVKLMWVNFPHMPTGRVASMDEMTALVELARRHRFLLVNDNPYSLILNDSPRSILAAPDASKVAMELNSLSKSHNMAGWRIGWVAGAKSYIEAVLKVKSNMDSGMFLPLQQAAAEALRNGAEWFDQLNAVYRKRRDTARKLLDALDCAYQADQSGLFLWARVPDRIGNVETWIDDILYGTNVFFTPGFVFGSGGRRHIRISLCAPEEKMEQALERIQRWKAGAPDVHTRENKMDAA
jgi:aspartate/methionine/tyrosine aminotransferase